MLHRIHNPERGASAAEYADVIALAAAIIAGLVVAAPLGRVRGDVAIPPAPAARPVPARPARRTGACPSAGSSPARAGRERRATTVSAAVWGMWKPPDDQEWFEFEDRGNYNWDCGQVFDVACKAGGGLVQGGRDLRNDAASMACLAHVCSHSGFKSTWDDTTQVFKQSPVTTAKQAWKGCRATSTPSRVDVPDGPCHGPSGTSSPSSTARMPGAYRRTISSASAEARGSTPTT